MPEAVVQLLIGLFLFLIWLRRFRQLQHRSFNPQLRVLGVRTRESRVRNALSALTNALLRRLWSICAYFERMGRHRFMPAGAEPQRRPEVEPPRAQAKPEEQATLEPRSTPCIVALHRRFFRCTEYDVDGALQTEVCAVNAFGQELRAPQVVPGDYRRVACDLLNQRSGFRRKGGR